MSLLAQRQRAPADQQGHICFCGTRMGSPGRKGILSDTIGGNTHAPDFRDHSDVSQAAGALDLLAVQKVRAEGLHSGLLVENCGQCSRPHRKPYRTVTSE